MLCIWLAFAASFQAPVLRDHGSTVRMGLVNLASKWIEDMFSRSRFVLSLGVQYSAYVTIFRSVWVCESAAATSDT